MCKRNRKPCFLILACHISSLSRTLAAPFLYLRYHISQCCILEKYKTFWCFNSGTGFMVITDSCYFTEMVIPRTPETPSFLITILNVSGRPEHRRCHGKNKKAVFYKFNASTSWLAWIEACNTLDDCCCFKIFKSLIKITRIIVIT